jgi:hypothetical protein
MAEYSNTGRVMGRKVGQMADGSNKPGPVKHRFMTPEQREEADQANLRSYQAWLAERNARLDRMRRFYMDRQLRHKDIVM